MCPMGKHNKNKMWWMIIFIPLFLAGYTFLVMSLWNWLMPDLVGAAELDFWKALGLIALVKLLFGFGGGGWKQKWGKKKHHWKHRMKERFEQMTPEEREAFKEKWRDRC